MMIYRSIRQGVEDLIAYWHRVQTAVNALPPGSPPLSQKVLDWIGRQPGHLNAVDVGQSDLPTLVRFARDDVFDESRQFALNLQATYSPIAAGAPERDELDHALNSILSLTEQFLQDLGELESDIGARFHLRGIRDSVDQVATYPVLTQETGPPAIAPSGGYAAPPGGVSIGTSVNSVLREVLAWRPRSDDPKGFLTALKHSFVCEEIDGVSECKWRPRSYVVQADIGAVTGAQASIFTRARVVLDQSKPLLEGLRPLASDTDAEDADACRAIVLSTLSELVNELGREGGPRVQRVDTCFELLLGPHAAAAKPGSPQQVQGELGEVREEFGLAAEEVNTVDEEQNLTNFLIVVDYVSSLMESWRSQRPYFDRGGAEVYLGTQLTLIARALAVAAESVQEVYKAMDSVFLGPYERQSAELMFTNGPSMFIEDLLSWVHTFTSEEGPRLIGEGGKRGVQSLHMTVVRLAQLTRHALLKSLGGQQQPDRVPAGYRTTRVQRAVEELADQLDAIATRAAPFKGKSTPALAGGNGQAPRIETVREPIAQDVIADGFAAFQS